VFSIVSRFILPTISVGRSNRSGSFRVVQVVCASVHSDDSSSPLRRTET
jgi:hypothetical protein